MDDKIRDVFISHAKEDKDEIALPLANCLIKSGLSVWIDEFEIHVGDSISSKINEGLSKSKFGIVILSPKFFSKKWADLELRTFISLMMAESNSLTNKLLPVYHNLTFEQVRDKYPLLSDIYGISSDQGVDHVCDCIIDVVSNKANNHSVIKDKIALLRAKLIPNIASYGCFRGLSCDIVTAREYPDKKVYVCFEAGDREAEYYGPLNSSFEGWHVFVYNPGKMLRLKFYVKMIVDNCMFIDNNDGKLFTITDNAAYIFNSEPFTEKYPVMLNNLQENWGKNGND